MNRAINEMIEAVLIRYLDWMLHERYDKYHMLISKESIGEFLKQVRELEEEDED